MERHVNSGIMRLGDWGGGDSERQGRSSLAERQGKIETVNLALDLGHLLLTLGGLEAAGRHVGR